MGLWQNFQETDEIMTGKLRNFKDTDGIPETAAKLKWMGLDNDPYPCAFWKFILQFCVRVTVLARIVHGRPRVVFRLLPDLADQHWAGHHLSQQLAKSDQAFHLWTREKGRPKTIWDIRAVLASKKVMGLKQTPIWNRPPCRPLRTSTWQETLAGWVSIGDAAWLMLEWPIRSMHLGQGARLKLWHACVFLTGARTEKLFKKNVWTQRTLLATKRDTDKIDVCDALQENLLQSPFFK